MTGTGEALAAGWAAAGDLMAIGGPAIWAIAVLSVVAVALSLWKLWRFARAGLWAGGRARRAVALWLDGHEGEAVELAGAATGLRARAVAAAMRARLDARLTPPAAEAEAERVARGLLAEAARGLRALDLIATIAPLLGLLGTVLGMIEAFRTLQAAGARADPAALAGGIWEALLTTAAGMAVAIVATVALAWFEGMLDRLRQDIEDMGTRVLQTPRAEAPARPRLVEP